MQKDEILKEIAQIGYDTAYGRDKCYSTLDIVSKVPNWFGLLFLCLGIASIGYQALSSKPIGVLTSIISVCLLYANTYNENLGKYLEAGRKLEHIFGQLKRLYIQLKNDNSPNLQIYINEYLRLQTEMREETLVKQIASSDAYAHVKMFWTKKKQSEWFVNALHLTLWDKLPLSAFLATVIIFLVSLGWGCGRLSMCLGWLNNTLSKSF